MDFLKRLGLFKEVKLPGWALFLYGLFVLIPDVKSRIDFWWDASQYLGGNVAAIGSGLTSPLSGIILMVVGVVYVVLVDEPKRPVFRQAWLRVAGWFTFGMIFLAVFAVTLISYVAQEIGPRRIYPIQGNIVRDILASAGFVGNYSVGITYVGTCYDCDGYAGDFVDLIKSVHGWTVVSGGTVLGPSHDLISPLGVAVLDKHPSTPSPATVVMDKALKAAQIPFDLLEARSFGNRNSSDTEIIISARRVRR
ncbi:hypothetical protein [Methylosinus sp. R-45379]|uniref:hypothetical protein n=1 Tax=Methylosinus sp. R-45379 TaxID=980563 RepID=UPI0012EE159E|nr:hypothetical protein [Methylosinus sp. R-45379]